MYQLIDILFETNPTAPTKGTVLLWTQHTHASGAWAMFDSDDFFMACGHVTADLDQLIGQAVT